jgi:hypothetical protein
MAAVAAPAANPYAGRGLLAVFFKGMVLSLFGPGRCDRRKGRLDPAYLCRHAA